MGAAGGVTIYKLADIEAKYAEMWPGHDVHKDWWYLDTITVELGDTKYVLDYADDQGYHEGHHNNFWFRSREDDLIDRPADIWEWDSASPYGFLGKIKGSHYRVIKVLRELTGTHVEVWT